MKTPSVVSHGVLCVSIVSVLAACGDGSRSDPTGPPGGTGAAASLDLTPGNVSLHALLDSTQLSAAVRDNAGNAIAGAPIGWVSTDTTVATVNAAGWIVARANGAAQVIASSGSLADTVDVVVSQRAAVVFLTSGQTTMAEGDTLRLTATAEDANGAPIGAPSVTWSSSKAAVITVDGDASLKGSREAVATAIRGGGEAVVTAKVDDVIASLTLTVLDRIAFVITISGVSSIFVINADGSGQKSLTPGAATGRFPVWSPDGTRIAFESTRDGNPEIYVMEADGSNPTRLTNNAAADVRPAWSPDGTKIAFVSERDGSREIYVMAANGSGQTRLTNSATDFDHPAWSPDGSRIAFSDPDDILIVNASGGGVTNLTNGGTTSTVLRPAWSPDGSRIAFWSYPTSIYVISEDGTDLFELTNEGLAQFAWSPDGQRLAFMALDGGNLEIQVRNADGSGLPTNVSNHTADDRSPVWSPDGSRIAFLSDRNVASSELYVMNADGTDVVRLTSNTREESTPTWRPRP